MAYILSRDLGAGSGPEAVERHQQQHRMYAEYLESIRGRLPESAFAFATAEWRHSEDRRSLRDSWVEWLTISEPSTGDRRDVRGLEIRVRLLGARHDGDATLRSREVQSYVLEAPARAALPLLGAGHGDWLRDEVRLSDSGFVIHEVEFSQGSRWIIESRDIEWAWEPRSDTQLVCD